MKTNIFLVLINKEFTEQWRSSRLLIFLAVFVFFGITSPLAAKFMPAIISSLVEDQNITIQIPEGTWKDASVQFVKNISQMGVFILILLSMGTVAREKENGTASFLLVKPVSRNLFVLSKFFSQFIFLLISMTAGFFTVVLYTKIFFGTAQMIPFAEISLILFVLLTVVQSVTIFFSIIIRNQIPAGILAFITILLLGLLSLPKTVGLYSPSHLIEESRIITEGSVVNWQPFAGSVVIIMCCIGFGIGLFRNWES